MDRITTTAEDRAWFNEDVSVQVEQDNRAWLDTMLEMNQAELVNYAVYQYAVPEAAAEVVGRNDLISMIAVANKAGGGQSVSNTEYLYIKELKGVLEPAVSLFKQDDDPLFLVRGQGSSAQVYDKITDTWMNLDKLKKEHAQTVTDTRAAATQAADTVANHPSFTQQQTATVAPVEPPKFTLSDATIAVIQSGSLKRADLVTFAEELGIEDTDNTETFKTNKDVIDTIVAANEENKKG